MTITSRILTVLLPVVLLGACASLSDEDKAAIAAANHKADQALATAQQALDTAKSAQTSAAQAANAAADAAANAKAANEKADRMFQRSLRK